MLSQATEPAGHGARSQATMRRRPAAVLIAAIVLVLFVTACTGPHRSPEAVTRAYLKARLAGDCKTLASLATPGEFEPDDCGSARYVEMQVDNILVGDTLLPDHKTVEVLGRFAYPNGVSTIKLYCSVRRLDRGWYVNHCG